MDRLPRATSLASALRPAMLAILVAYAAVVIAGAIALWTNADLEAYWQAALRLREGDALYRAWSGPLDSETYRYAPWFAAAWVPLTYLPHASVTVAWDGIILAATAFCAWRAARRSVPLALLFVPPLFVATSLGNVQALLIAGLLWQPRPWMVGLASSLKVTPAVLAAGWPWWRIGLVAVVAVALWLPALAFGVGTYPVGAGTMIDVPLWLHLALGVASVVLAWRVPRYRGWFAALAVVLITPRFNFYDASYLLVAFAATADEPAAQASQRLPLSPLSRLIRPDRGRERRASQGEITSAP
jgi:hypothetical protein